MGKNTQSWISWTIGIVSVVVSALLWLGSTFTTREKFEDYQKSHGEWSQQVLKELHSDLNDIKASVIRIENRLDRVKLGAVVLTNNNINAYGKRIN